MLSQGTKSGFLFSSLGATGTPTTQFVTNAYPTTVNTTGVKGFCGVEDNVVRFISPSTGASVSEATCQGYTAIGQ